MIRIWELELKQQSKSRKPKREKKEKKKKEGDWIQAKLEFDSKEEQELAAEEEQEESQQQKKLALTPILPIVFYHGTQEWKVPLGFQDHGHACPPYFFRSSRLACPLCAQFSVFLRHASVAL